MNLSGGEIGERNEVFLLCFLWHIFYTQAGDGNKPPALERPVRCETLAGRFALVRREREARMWNSARREGRSENIGLRVNLGLELESTDGLRRGGADAR